MTGFRTIPSTSTPLRVALVGAGPMGRAWLRTISTSSDVELVGVVDLDLTAAQGAIEAEGLPAVPTARSVSELTSRHTLDAVINVTVPAAHHAVTTEALLAGLPVLSEKPIATTVAEGLSLVAASELSGELLMVSQSRRYYRAGTQFKNIISTLGEVGLLTTEFLRAPRFGGFREAMDHPLLVDMAIHSFDACRFYLDDEPVSVYCEEFNPPWSWYKAGATSIAIFEMRSGARYIYTGSWCSPGLETSWNGNWRVSAPRGSAVWNGEDDPTWESEHDVRETDPGPVLEEIDGALAEFVTALRSGVRPNGLAAHNVPSLAMVEAATRSAALGARVRIADVVTDAYSAALANEVRGEITDILRSWDSAPAALGL